MFTYDSYFRYLQPFKPFHTSFREALNLENFALIRHDVEFDMERAFALAQLEEKESIKSTYFIQVSSDAYNAASARSHWILQEIMAMGHDIGLHLYTSHLDGKKAEDFKNTLSKQMALISIICDREIDTFSVHRPQAWFLEMREDIIHGYLNAYGPTFFEYSKNPVEIKYFADSMHCWNYGEPKLIETFKKYQILLHPDEWYDRSNNLEENYRLTFEAHCNRFAQTLVSENKRFSMLGRIR